MCEEERTTEAETSFIFDSSFFLTAPETFSFRRVLLYKFPP